MGSIVSRFDKSVTRRCGRVERLPRSGEPTGGGDEPDPYLWVLLADQAHNAGRHEQARTLIAEAFAAFDRAMPMTAFPMSEPLEEDAGSDPE